MHIAGWIARSLPAIATGALFLLPASLAWTADHVKEIITGLKKSIPDSLFSKLATGTALDVIVLYDDRDVDDEAAASRLQAGRVHDNEAILTHARPSAIGSANNEWIPHCPATGRR